MNLLGGFMLREDLKLVQELLAKSEISEKQIKDLEGLTKRLEDQEFIISVVGQFKRGKSSFINAILKEEILPTGIIPVTSVVTMIQYGKKKAQVVFEGSHVEEVEFQKLKEYINEEENPKNIKKVDCVKLYLDLDFLKSGLVLVDTPGVGSTHRHNTEEVYKFISKSDAIIFMLSVDSPINEIEVELLESTKDKAAKFYFTVNKIDTVSNDDLEEYISYCRSILSELMGDQELKLIPISSKTRVGIDELFSEILGDIQSSGREILENSVRIKFNEILRKSLAQIEFYISGLKMPSDRLEDKARELREKSKDLDKLIKEASFNLDWSVEDLIENLRKTTDEKIEEIIKINQALIDKAYRDNKAKGSSQLEEEFEKVLEENLKEDLSKLNNSNLEKLEKHYEKMVAITNESILDLKIYLKKIIWDLFSIEYYYETIDETLSERDDYYVKIIDRPDSVFIDRRKLLYILPRKYANRKFYEEYYEKVGSDSRANANNMVYNYRYKLRESLRSLDASLAKESRRLQEELEDLMEKIIREKESSMEENKAKISEMEDLTRSLKALLDE